MNIKKKSSHQERSSKRSAASKVECFLVGVGDLTDGELARRLLRRLSGGVDAQVVRRPRCTELPRRFEPSLCSEPLCHSEPAASASSPVSIVLEPGVVSQSPDDCHRCPVYHSASLPYSSHSSCNVWLPPIDDIHAVSELAVVSSIDQESVVYQQLHVAQNACPLVLS